MEEQINKMIKDYFAKIFLDKPTEDVAKEITSHIIEFIEWISEERWSKYKKLDWWVKKDHKIPPKNPPLTLNELYQYWLNNVKQ